MMKKKQVGMLLMMVAFLSCSKGIKTTQAVKKTVDWEGVYTGITPCDDCAGQKMQLTLSKDYNFVLKQRFTGKSDSVYLFKGKFVLNDSNNQITLSGVNPPNQFKMLNGKLQRLDVEGKPIEGGFAGAYYLNKVNYNNSLFNQKWTLFSLNGKMYINAANQQSPHFKINKKDSSTTGFLGCNTFMAKAKISADTLTFSQLVSTLMACEPMQTEQELSSIFQKVKQYQFMGGMLFLNDEKKQNLASFELDFFAD